MAKQPDKGGGSPQHRVNKKPGAPKTLAERKIDKNLAERVRPLATFIEINCGVHFIGGMFGGSS